MVGGVGYMEMRLLGFLGSGLGADSGLGMVELGMVLR